MALTPLLKIAHYCDRLLETSTFVDSDRALNGLQVENSGRPLRRIAAAVDATLATVKLAAAAGANLLVVHHGLFWNKTQPWVGKQYEIIRTLMDNDLAVYSSHLPLDAHRLLGNNAQLGAALRFKQPRPFFENAGRKIGLEFRTRLTREELRQRLDEKLGREPIVAPGGPAVCRRIGIVTGAAGDKLAQAAKEGVDTLITGEGPHWSFALAEELGINVFYGGHYATETFGVKALAAHLSRKFRVPWLFIEYPTGL